MNCGLQPHEFYELLGTTAYLWITRYNLMTSINCGVSQHTCELWGTISRVLWTHDDHSIPVNCDIHSQTVQYHSIPVNCEAKSQEYCKLWIYHSSHMNCQIQSYICQLWSIPACLRTVRYNLVTTVNSQWSQLTHEMWHTISSTTVNSGFITAWHVNCQI